jgi:hypothetical protein
VCLHWLHIDMALTDTHIYRHIHPSIHPYMPAYIHLHTQIIALPFIVCTPGRERRLLRFRVDRPRREGGGEARALLVCVSTRPIDREMAHCRPPLVAAAHGPEGAAARHDGGALKGKYTCTETERPPPLPESATPVRVVPIILSTKCFLLSKPVEWGWLSCLPSRVSKGGFLPLVFLSEYCFHHTHARKPPPQSAFGFRVVAVAVSVAEFLTCWRERESREVRGGDREVGEDGA